MTQSTLPRTIPSAVGAGRAAPPAATPRQYALGTAILLHLYPGLALSAFVVATASTFEAWGLEALFALLLGIGVVLVPLELGYLMIYARRTTGSWSPLAAVDCLAKLPVRRRVLLGGGLAAFMLLFVVAHMAFVDQVIAPLFAWMPATLFQFSAIETGGEPLAGGALTVMIVAILVFNGVPFMLYHLHAVAMAPGVAGGVADVLAGRRHRSVYVPMAAHLIVNMVFSLLMIASYLSAA